MRALLLASLASLAFGMLAPTGPMLQLSVRNGPVSPCSTGSFQSVGYLYFNIGVTGVPMSEAADDLWLKFPYNSNMGAKEAIKVVNPGQPPVPCMLEGNFMHCPVQPIKDVQYSLPGFDRVVVRYAPTDIASTFSAKLMSVSHPDAFATTEVTAKACDVTNTDPASWPPARTSTATVHARAFHPMNRGKCGEVSWFPFALAASNLDTASAPKEVMTPPQGLVAKFVSDAAWPAEVKVTVEAIWVPMRAPMNTTAPASAPASPPMSVGNWTPTMAPTATATNTPTPFGTSGAARSASTAQMAMPPSVDCVMSPTSTGGSSYKCDLTSFFPDTLPQVGDMPAWLRVLVHGVRTNVTFSSARIYDPSTAPEVNAAMIQGIAVDCDLPDNTCWARPLRGYKGGCPTSLPGDNCTVTECDTANGFSGAVASFNGMSSGTLWCNWEGRWEGHPRGCERVLTMTAPRTLDTKTIPACGNKTFAAYGECESAYEGDMCTFETCAAGYTEARVGASKGSVTCQNTRWVGEFHGCGLTVPDVMCGPPRQKGYTYNCTDGHNAECRPTGCSPKFEEDPSVPLRGWLKCQNGKWEGREFEGCMPVAALGQCSTAPAIPEKYLVENCTFDATTGFPSFTQCGLTCNKEMGYFGRAAGSAMCYDGQWYVNAAGCSTRCQLPPSMCDPATGALADGLSVRGVFGEQRVDGGCYLHDEGRIGLWRAGCARGFELSQDSMSSSQSAAVCLNGALIGGFATHGAPVCVPEETAVKRECTCGKPGSFATTSSQARWGRSRVNTKNQWSCDTVQNIRTCRCEC